MIGPFLFVGSFIGGLAVWLLGIRPYLLRHGVTVINGATDHVSAWGDWQQCREFARTKNDSRASLLSKIFILAHIGFVGGIVLTICHV